MGIKDPEVGRYLGMVREEETSNIPLDFIPGGSISSFLGKFGSFPEEVSEVSYSKLHFILSFVLSDYLFHPKQVIRMYTKQLLLGLDYLAQEWHYALGYQGVSSF
ncbi:mitogen-activated protein kinase kinase kinase NPK1 [Artemisia annua]|uniref:Mitogen-activated protein kinase kinase kinase NPK1 n=1 Tax=Artemisia annua TaxID=35608 RepID=A0A2U1MVR7_ARTAN|nr:mitogen-activated protein kinase kinase kinase NPK1 [Artemisia annua]